MYLDKQLLLSDSQSVGGSGSGSAYSENAIDLSEAQDLGKGKPVAVVVVFEADVSASTLQISVVEDDDSTIGGDSTVLVQTAAIAYTSLPKGKVIVLPLPEGIQTQRYLGVAYTRGNTLTAIVSAFLAFDY